LSGEVHFIHCPPWEPGAPNLSIAYLAQTLTAAGLGCRTVDLSQELHRLASPELRTSWDMGHSGFWWKSAPVERAMPPALRQHVHDEVNTLLQEAPLAVGLTMHNLNTTVVQDLVDLLWDGGYRGLVVVGGPAVRLPDDRGVPRFFGLPCSDLGEEDGAARLARFLRRVDAFVYREGELTLLELVRRFQEGGRDALPGTPGALVMQQGLSLPVVARPQVEPLDALPWPTFDDVQMDRYEAGLLPLLWSRGCPRSCSMCFQRSLWPGYRYRDPAQAVEEISFLTERHGVSRFHAYDQTTNGSITFVDLLCAGLIQRDLRPHLTGNTIVRSAMTRARLARMRRAGFRDIIFGVESGSPGVLRRMNKQFDVPLAERVLADASGAGLRTHVNLMVGFPGETEAEFDETLMFLQRNRRAISRVTLAGTTKIYPETALSRRPDDFGVLPHSIGEFGALAACSEWQDRSGLDQALRFQRFQRLHARVQELGIPMEYDPEVDVRPAGQQPMDRLGPALVSDDPFRREQAASALDDDLNEELLPYLRQALDDDSVVVRGRALVALATLAPDEALPLVLRHRRSPVRYEQRLATEALCRVGGAVAFEHLEPLLAQDRYAALDWRLREQMTPLRRAYAPLEVLIHQGPDALAPGDLAGLFRFAPRWIQLRALGALARWPEHPEAPAPEEALRRAARGLTSDAPGEAKAAADALAAMGSKEALALLERAMLGDAGEARCCAMASLTREVPERVKALAIEMLASGSEQDRYNAALIMADLGGNRAFEHLEPLLRQGRWSQLDEELRQRLAPLRVTYRCIEQLEAGALDLPGEEVLGLLRSGLPWIRLRAIAAVLSSGRGATLPRQGPIGAEVPSLMDLYEEGLAHPVPAVVHAALKALVLDPDPQAAELLHRFLSRSVPGALPQAWVETLGDALDSCADRAEPLPRRA